MHVVLKKVTIGFMLIVCALLLFACSSDAEEKDESSNEQADTSIEENKTTETDETMKSEQNKSDDQAKEEDVPKSEFTYSEMLIGSIFLKSSMGVSSDIEKEVMETLTEFNAVSTDEGAKLTLPEDILFDFDSHELRSEADKVIDQLVQVTETTDDEVTIVGHTDARGEEAYNQELSLLRAEAVLQALVDAGVNEDRLHAEGKGASEPVAKNTNSDGSDNPEGRQKNRRVEVTVHGFNQ